MGFPCLVSLDSSTFPRFGVWQWMESPVLVVLVCGEWWEHGLPSPVRILPDPGRDPLLILLCRQVVHARHTKLPTVEYGHGPVDDKNRCFFCRACGAGVTACRVKNMVRDQHVCPHRFGLTSGIRDKYGGWAAGPTAPTVVDGGFAACVCASYACADGSCS